LVSRLSFVSFVYCAYDCQDRLRLAVYLESLELFYDEIIKSEKFQEYHKSLKVIHDHVLKSLYVAKTYAISSMKGQFANEVENERFYYQSPTFDEANNILNDEYRKLKKERNILEHKVDKLENRIYVLEKELGKSHHKHMDANDSTNDEVVAIKALSNLDEASQYRAIEIALNRVRRRPEESKKSIELTLKYDAESEQGLLGILTSVAEKLPANKVIHATMNVVGNIDENQVKEEMKSSFDNNNNNMHNNNINSGAKYGIWKDKSLK